jgi:thioester reductase-like protein
MTGDAQHDNGTIAHRTAEFCAHDGQIRAAIPEPDVVEAARRPGLRLPQVLETYVEGYADRPALGWRARKLTTDPATGRTTTQVLPGQPLRGAPAPTEVFRDAVRSAKIGADDDIPHLSAPLIDKYIADLEHLGLLATAQR